MRTRYALSFAATVVALTVLTHASAQRSCGSMDYLQQQIQADPDRGELLQLIDQQTEQWIAQYGHDERAVVTIPVVFHVIWRTTAENISDARLLAQLNQLNADFARLNSDASSTPSVFQGVAANTQIQFCLAQRDPNGAATTGIVRRQTTATSFSSNDAVKYTSSGGSNAWPRNNYLNIWVCNLGGGLLGYAQFPGGAAATDGVVVLYSAVGGMSSPGTATPFHLGRTLTHEVGHWLNLRHIWGDATCGNDQVSDTPVHNTANYGCPSHPHYSTCSGTPMEMFMNYMDYSDDGCMNMFSNGQSARMQALFGTSGSRVSLLTSLGCVPPSGGTTCAIPTGLAATSITSSTATVSWNAVSGASSYNLQYKLASASTWTTFNTTGTSVNFTGLSAGTSYNAQVQAVCASGSSAFSSAITFTTSAAACTDTWESNNTSGTAKVIPVNANINGLINSGSDVDWYRFNNTSSQPRIRIDLGTLPADYDVRLYRGTSTQVGISQNGGTTSEVIILNTSTVATYYLRVYGYNGAFNAGQCYTLRASISGSNFRDGQLDEEIPGEVTLERAEGLMGLYPNPATDKITIDYIGQADGMIGITVVDAMGREVYTTRQAIVEGPLSFGLPLPSLGHGLYVLRVQEGDRLQQHRFTIGQ